ncbi:cupin domain-containing protein [Kitasatospora sp. McL0602]|uniref:cupin domain-containing protein n=1 Tax=Kitasatospora sp. McL0602 TaxID=3439530 RepID=UPI003F8A0B9E
MTAQLLAELPPVLPPVLFSGIPGEVLARLDLDFHPVVADGRVGIEMHQLYSARATEQDGPSAALVRYLPGATTASHRHPGYELIYVLSGVLETEDGVYPENSLLVMPPDSVHAPHSPAGCLVLVVWEQPVRLA